MMMRPAKSINSLSSQQTSYERRPRDPSPPEGARQKLQQQVGQSSSAFGQQNNNQANPTSPICRCRVMYLGSSVPSITKDGLQGIQEPLRELYPDKAALASGNAGIDSWLSVWSNGILIENVDENGREVKRFFKIDALHYCAAVKYVSTSKASEIPLDLPKFLPLDSPHARQIDSSNPPVFASILRRTTGIKVLECHAFICKREAAANALVRCCFHAYADTMYAKQIGADISSVASSNSQAPMTSKRSKSIAALNEPDNNNNNRLEPWRNSDGSANSQYGDNNHQRMVRRKSINESHYAANNCDNPDSYGASNKLQQVYNEPLKRQQKLSKSLYQLNNVHQQQLYENSISRDQVDHYDQSTSASCLNIADRNRWQQQVVHDNNQVPLPQQPFYNAQAGRVPSYPPQSIIDAATTNNGGTLKSIKSMAANSIASTLLRSKKHAKAMSMAQLNQQQQQLQQSFDKVISFHQPHLGHNISAATIGPAGLHAMGTMPPIPPMFLPNLPANHHIALMNGSQTMKLPSRPLVPLVGPPRPPVNFEPMTPKEMKKLLKKSAKYGIDPSKFTENGLSLFGAPPPGPPPPIMFPPPPPNKSGTMVSQSNYSDIYGPIASRGAGMCDMGLNGVPPPPPHLMDQLDPAGSLSPPMKPILVKPNPEFLKSKAGKKWLKQQREFKKLLPPHLDGLPVVFGPPPPEALEPAFCLGLPPPPPANFSGPLPVLDSNGYYNPHPFYGQNGRASAASTLLRHSPSLQSQLMHHHHEQQLIYQMNDLDHRNPNQYGLIEPPPPGQPLAMQHPSFRSIQHRDQYENGSLIYGNAECMPNSHRSNHHHHHHHHSDNQRNTRNLMVEQSVISLGDENDYDDEEEEQEEGELEAERQEHRNHSHRHLEEEQDSKQGTRSGNSYSHPSDDQSSYSSGFYKRGHINERAFSYSIRQEHKSSDSTTNEMISDNDIDCHENNNDYYQHHHNGQHQKQQQPISVNDLSARLENQLSMKSFANQSRIKNN